MNKKGFTLIELLAVIVILALIIVVVATNGFGAFDKAKEKIEQEHMDNIKESVNVLLAEVENCSNTTRDFENLKQYFDISGECESCENLQYRVSKGISLNSDKLIEDSYIDGKEEKKKLENENIRIIVGEGIDGNKELSVGISDNTISISDIGKPTTETILCGKKSFGEEKLYYGDVNLDGNINGGDRMHLARILSEETAWENYKFNVLTEELSDLNGDNITDTNDETVMNKIFGGWTIESRSGEEYNGLPPNEDNLCGDVDNDGNIDDKDKETLENYLNKYLQIEDVKIKETQYLITNFQKRRGDINGNGIIESNDVMILEKYLNAE